MKILFEYLSERNFLTPFCSWGGGARLRAPMPNESISRGCCNRQSATSFAGPVEVVLAFDIQGRCLDGHSDCGKLLLHKLREAVQNGLRLRAAGAAGGAPRLPPQWLTIARVQCLRVYMQKT